MATFATRARTLADIATSVRDARLAAGMSQADLASAAHLNRSWVSLFEGGHTPNASLSKVLAMLDVLGITVRLSYSVPDSEPDVHQADRRPPPRSAGGREADHAETVPTAAAPPLDEVALATARAIRETHRARAIADEIARRPSSG